MIPQFKVYTSPKAKKKVGKVLESGYIAQGEKVEKFEQTLQDYLGFDYGLTVNSCTSALWLALHLIGVEGGEVITTPMTCSATNIPIVQNGAKIVWADVDRFGNIDPEDVGRKINGNTRAIVVVDWGGTPADYITLKECSGDVPIIEDAAHAFGAKYYGQDIAKVGGDFVCYSFQAIKHLTTGDGGLLVVPAKYYERAKLLRWFGLDRTQPDAMRSYQDIAEPGFKFHLNDVAATIGLANMSGAIKNLAKHRENAAYYNSALIDLTHKGVSIIEEPNWWQNSSWWIYTIHVNKPLDFINILKYEGVQASQVHNRNDRYSCFSEFKVDLPQLDKWFDTMVCVPNGWWMDQKDLDFVVDLIYDWTQK